MIFITVGTEKFPFNRLLKTIDEGVKNGKIHNQVFAQIGNTNYTPSTFKFERFLPFEQLTHHIKKAEIVITHAGVGSTLLCLILDKIPILFPRYAAYGEHIDDHQVEFSRKLVKEKVVLVSFDEKDLLYKINLYQQMVKEFTKSKKNPPKKELFEYLKKIIEEKELNPGN